MKKTLLAFFVLCVFAFTAKAADFSVSASTYPITEAATMAAQITGTARIDKLVISNSTSTIQTVTVYKSCASTTTVTAILTVVMKANVDPLVLDFTGNYNNPFSVASICFRKSDSTDPVYISAHYR